MLNSASYCFKREVLQRGDSFLFSPRVFVLGWITCFTEIPLRVSLFGSPLEDPSLFFCAGSR